MIEKPVVVYAIAGMFFWLLFLPFIFAFNFVFSSFWAPLFLIIFTIWTIMSASALYEEIKVKPDLSSDDRRKLFWAYFALPIPLSLALWAAFVLWSIHNTSVHPRGVTTGDLLAVAFVAFVGMVVTLTIAGFIARAIHRVLTHYNPDPPEEVVVAEPEEAPPPDERYLDWIRDHKLSPGKAATEEYLNAAKEIVEAYNEERLAPTTNELTIARRRGEPPQTLGQVQYLLYEQYKSFVEKLPKSDGYPPFPLFPVNSAMWKAADNLYNAVRPILPWSYKAEPIALVFSDEGHSKIGKDIDKLMQQRRMTKDDEKYEKLTEEIDHSFKVLDDSIRARQMAKEGKHYLHETPFATFVDALPRVRNGTKRFEGTFILAPSGSGKSTTLQYLIENDFSYLTQEILDQINPLPVTCQASIIAMDSTGEFLRTFLSLPLFSPLVGSVQGALLDNLIIIEPNVETPLALNPFAFGRNRIDSYSAREREKLTNNTIDLLAHVFSTMADGMKFTPRQALVYRQCVRLCLAIPNSNLSTLAEIITKASVDKYQQYVDALDETAQSFFNGDFRTPDIKKVCQTELSWRLNAVLENPTFAKMMNAPDCKIDFFTELNSGKLIIVNTDRAFLGDERAGIFGRLIIALVRLAMRERDTVPEEKRKPCYFYIDECHEFLDNDTQIATMIDDVRKSRLGLVLVTQRLAKIKDPNVRDALLSCGILMAKPNAEDATSVARYMQTDPDNLINLPAQTFRLFARNVTPAINVRVPDFSLSKYGEKLTAEEQQRTREIVAAKYSYKPSPKEPAPQAPENSSGSVQDGVQVQPLTDDDDIQSSNKL